MQRFNVWVTVMLTAARGRWRQNKRTVGSHKFNSQNFGLSVSNPVSKCIANPW